MKNETYLRQQTAERDYYSDWAVYAYAEEENRFLSDERLKNDLCTKVSYEPEDGKNRACRSEGGGIPLLAEEDAMYLLKDGHTLVQGESGSKKSRSVAKPAVIAGALRGQSMVVNDPKGEISSDPMIMEFLKECGIESQIIDFREFNKQGFNFFHYPLRLIREGNMQRASIIISRFVHSLVADVKTNDDFWNDMAVMQLESLIVLLLTALAQKEDGEIYANMATIISFIAKEKEILIKVMEKAVDQLEEELYNPAAILLEIYKNPERTFACINSTAITLLKDFMTQESLTKLLSVSSFEPRELYEKPMAVFLVVPDETKAFDHIAGQLIDTIYQQLVDIYAKQYQNQTSPCCQVHFILDEFCNTRVNDMSEKISAARSRELFFTLIYQTDKQLEQAYEKDAGTIKGNCKNHIFLGSSDYEVLSNISQAAGTIEVCAPDGSKEVVSVGDLRKMQKNEQYKDALLIRENVLYCAKLPDYGQFQFLHKYRNRSVIHRNDIMGCQAQPYTPLHFWRDLNNRQVRFPYRNRGEEEKWNINNLLDELLGEQLDGGHKYDTNDQSEQ